jgi:hypothetical protein
MRGVVVVAVLVMTVRGIPILIGGTIVMPDDDRLAIRLRDACWRTPARLWIEDVENQKILSLWSYHMGDVLKIAVTILNDRGRNDLRMSIIVQWW